MKYLNQTFTLPANSKRGITDREYDIRVGRRCAKCERLIEKCSCKKRH